MGWICQWSWQECGEPRESRVIRRSRGGAYPMDRERPLNLVRIVEAIGLEGNMEKKNGGHTIQCS